jgi:YVTN family beta-propeller protein
MLRQGRFIPIPTGPHNRFDHGAFDPQTGRIFVAHTSADGLAVLDVAAARYETTLPGFAEAAGVAVAGGTVLVSNRAAATLTVVDAATLTVGRTYATGVRPNGIALAPKRGVALAACLGDETAPPVLEAIDLDSGARTTLPLPGRPRWCLTDQNEEHLFCAIQEPSLVLVVSLAAVTPVASWNVPAAGAHGMDLDEAGRRLFVACDAGELVVLAATSGAVQARWPLPGPPDVTWFNPDSGRVHVAVKSPGVVYTVDPTSGETTTCPTETAAGTTALVRPDRLYAFLPERSGALELCADRGAA